MTITMGYAGVLALLYLALSLLVIEGRMARGGPSLGEGGQAKMLRRIRAHGNFAEYVPLVLVLLAMLEHSGAYKWLIHVLGVLLVVGLLLHGYAFALTDNHPLGRMVGMVLTLLVLLVAACMTLWKGFLA